MKFGPKKKIDKKHIILIGFMGCGKTAIGRNLSFRLRTLFIDMDSEIEKKEGMKINDIFEQKGEEYFREAETNLLKSFLQIKNKRIISTGGGVIKKEENIELLKKLGLVVYLRYEPSTLLNRLKNDKKRPLLKGDAGLENAKKLFEERKSIYESTADIIVDCDNHKIQEVVNLVEAKIKERIEKDEKDEETSCY